MADIEPPSFSLGFDLDDDEPLPAARDHSQPTILDEEDVLGPEAMDSDPDTAAEPPRIFRRIRRGLPKPAPKHLDDDDIESFSDEDPIGGNHVLLCLMSITLPFVSFSSFCSPLIRFALTMLHWLNLLEANKKPKLLFIKYAVTN